MAEKETEKEIERIYVIPLRKAKIGRTSLAAPRAVKLVRNYLTKHMKVDSDDIWIDDSLNRELWSRGKFKINSKIRVRAVKFEDGVVEVTIPEIGEKKSRRELLKEEKEKKTPILRREEEEKGEGAGIGGADDYDISPSADGEVKIKKKKTPKEEKTETKVKTTNKKEEKKTEKKPKESPKKTEKTTTKKKTTSKKLEKKK
jgi:large subunit ribosomal protein L31e